MKIVKWWSSTGMQGCDRDGEIEVEDDATEEEITALVREEVFSYFEWGHEVAVDTAPAEGK